MITVDRSVIVDSCCAKTPLEFATPIANEDVVINPAAEQPVPAAFRQMTPALAARCSGVHQATAESKASTREMV